MARDSDVRRARFVSFSGIDGAGKTTQIEALRSRLTEAGLRVRLITFWNDVATLTGIREATGHAVFKGDKGVGSPDAPIHRRDKNVRSWPMTGVRLCLYLLDSLSLRTTIQKAVRSDVDFIICDRYIYDELANLSLRTSFARMYIRLIMKFIPRPDISFVLDADPMQARARKPEYPVEFLHTSRASYLALGDLLGGITVIAPMSAQDVHRHVLQPVLELLPSEDRSRVLYTNELAGGK